MSIMFDQWNKIAELFSKEHWKEKRKERVNYIEIIELFTCISDK